MSNSPIRGFDRDRFRDLRLRRGYSLASLARKAELSPSTIRHWESGLYCPSMEALAPTLEVLGGTPAAVVSIPPGTASLSDLRVLALVSSSDAASALELTLSGLYAIERGDSSLSRDKAHVLSDLYDLPLDVVLDAAENDSYLPAPE